MRLPSTKCTCNKWHCDRIITQKKIKRTCLIQSANTLRTLTLHRSRSTMEILRLIVIEENIPLTASQYSYILRDSVKIFHRCRMLLLRLNPPGLWQEIWQSKYSTDFQTSFSLAAEWLPRDGAATHPTFCDSYPNVSLKSFAQEKVQQFVSGFIAFSCLAARHLSWTTQQDKTAPIQFKLDRWATTALAQAFFFFTLSDCIWHGAGFSITWGQVLRKMSCPSCNLMTCHSWTSVRKSACSAKGPVIGRVQSGGHLCLWQVTWCSWLHIFPSVSRQHTGRIEQTSWIQFNG